AAELTCVDRQTGVPIVPFLLEGLAPNATLDLADSIHGKAAGKGSISDRFWRRLWPLLSGSRWCSALPSLPRLAVVSTVCARRARHAITVTRPTATQTHPLAHHRGFPLADPDAQSFLGLMAGTFAAYDAVAAMPDHVPAVKYPRTPGYRPEGAENRYNAWYV